VNVTFQDIEKAQSAIAGQIIRTPTVKATRLSLRSGVNIYLKLENLQHTASFKARGALNCLLNLDEDAKKRGVIASSAGNHAQGLAFHASRLGIPATIVMPKGTAFNKVQKTEEFGAKVILAGDNYDETQAFTHELAAQENLAFVHPFDDPHVVAGQGTLGIEMLEDQPDLHKIVVPIGGGGLISGVATAVKHMNPEIEVIGAQADLYNAVKRDYDANTDQVTGGATLAEGIAVKTPAARTLRIIKQHVQRIESASEEEIEDAIFNLLSSEKLVAEGAAGAGLAAIFKNKEEFKGQNIGLVLCGGNIDSRLLSTLILRGMLREGRIARLRFEIDDTPGQLADISNLIGDEGANVIEVIHQRLMQAVPLKRAELDMVIEARDSAHVQEILTSLRGKGFKVQQMNEVA
jgi:threonine dehydratase